MSLRSIHSPKSVVQKTCHVDHILKSVTVKCRPTNIHPPKVSGQNVDHVNFRDIFICFTQKYSKTNEKT